MKKKLLILLVIMCIALAGVGYAFYATGGFKSNKELFIYYLTKSEKQSKYIDTINEYNKKKTENSYKTKGKAELKVTGAEDDESIQMLNNSKLTFEGKINPTKKMTEQEITAVLGMGINVPLKYKQDGDLFAVQTNLLTSKYIAIKNENLKQLAKRFNVDSEEIPDKINFERSDIDLENINEISERYKNIFFDNLPGDEAFTKETNGNKKVLTMTLTDKEMAQFFKSILKELRNEELIVKNAKDKNIDLKEYYNSIDSLIKELDEIEDEEGKTLVKLNVEKEKVTGIDIFVYDDENDVIAKIEAEMNNDKLEMKINIKDEMSIRFNYEIQYNDKDVSMNFDIKMTVDKTDIEFKGIIELKNIFALDNVEENYSIELIGDMDEIEKIGLNYSNLVTFDNNIEIEKISEKNSYIINNMSDSELQSFIIAIYQKLSTIQ